MRAEILTELLSGSKSILLSDVLGPADDRYFGAGYRDVDYSLSSAGRETGSSTKLIARGAAAYPARWSVGADGAERVPHLSSVDAIVLPLITLEMLISPEARYELSSFYVESIELRAGPSAWLDLDDVPVHVAIVENLDRRVLVSTVGNIRSKVTLKRGEAASGDLRDATIGDPNTVYGGLFRSIFVQTQSAELNLSAPSLRAAHEVVATRHQPPASGIGAAYWPAPTVIDYLVTMGQLTQAVVYIAGDTNRSKVGTLWMRTMEISLGQPLLHTSAFETETRLLRDRVVARGGRRVHDLLVESSATSGVIARSSLAYSENSGNG